jgi:copper(I)-binding protein
MIRITSSALLLALGACAQTPADIAVQEVWARETAPGATSAAIYATLENRGGTADRLIGISTDRASMAMLHENKTEAGVARMRMIDSIDVPANGRLELAPGGAHIMLDGLGAPLARGDRFQAQLRFQSSGVRTVEVVVEPAGAR